MSQQQTCRSQNSTRVLHENGKWKQTLRNGWEFYSREQEKNTHLWLWDQSVADTKTCILFVDKFFSTVILGNGYFFQVVELGRNEESLPFFSTWVFTWVIEGWRDSSTTFIFASKAENVLNKCVMQNIKPFPTAYFIVLSTVFEIMINNL